MTKIVLQNFDNVTGTWRRLEGGGSGDLRVDSPWDAFAVTARLRERPRLGHALGQAPFRRLWKASRNSLPECFSK